MTRNSGRGAQPRAPSSRLGSNCRLRTSTALSESGNHGHLQGRNLVRVRRRAYLAERARVPVAEQAGDLTACRIPTGLGPGPGREFPAGDRRRHRSLRRQAVLEGRMVERIRLDCKEQPAKFPTCDRVVAYVDPETFKPRAGPSGPGLRPGPGPGHREGGRASSMDFETYEYLPGTPRTADSPTSAHRTRTRSAKKTPYGEHPRTRTLHLSRLPPAPPSPPPRHPSLSPFPSPGPPSHLPFLSSPPPPPLPRGEALRRSRARNGRNPGALRGCDRAVGPYHDRETSSHNTVNTVHEGWRDRRSAPFAAPGRPWGAPLAGMRRR